MMNSASACSPNTGPMFLDGMMCVTCEEPKSRQGCDCTGEPEQLMLWRAGFPARTSQSREPLRESTVSEAVYFLSSPVWLANFDPVLCSWRMSQISLLTGERLLLPRLPRWGMTANGALYQRQPLVLPTGESAGFAWPTPRTAGLIGGSGSKRKMLSVVRAGLNQNEAESMAGLKLWATPQARDWKGPTNANRNTPLLPDQITGRLNPVWVESLMGFPSGWTEVSSPPRLTNPSGRGKRRAPVEKSPTTPAG